MLPEPMIAERTLMPASPEADRALADAFDRELHAVASRHRNERSERARQHDLAGAKHDAARAELVGEPRHGDERRAHRCGAGTRADDLAVLLEPHAAADEVGFLGRYAAIAGDEHSRRRVVGDRVLDLDLPVA